MNETFSHHAIGEKRMTTSPPSLSNVSDMTKRAGELLLGNDYEAALRSYLGLFTTEPGRFDGLSFNFCIARRRYRLDRQRQAPRRAIVAGSAPVDPAALPAASGPFDAIFVTRPNSLRQASLDAAAPMPGLRHNFLFLEDAADLRPHVFSAVLACPHDEIHLTDDSFIGLIWGVYYALIWDAKIHLPAGAKEKGFDAAFHRASHLVASAKDGPKFSSGNMAALDAAFAGAGSAFVEEGSSRNRWTAALLNDRAGRVFSLLGGWEALKHLPAPGLETIACGPAPEQGPAPASAAVNAPVGAGQSASGQSARLIGAARANVLLLEKEVLGFLHDSPAVLRGGATAEPHETQARHFARNVSRSIQEIKESLSQARSHLPEEGFAASPMLQQALARQIDTLAALYPATPYYRRLRQVVADCGDPLHLAQIRDTLTRVDLRRQGQLPPLDGPLVSVVMPVFNRANLVLDAIGSVLSQSHGRFELLICDDASSDETVRVIKGLDDRRIRLIGQETRQGAAAARNRCLDIARGDVIAYLDSDNIWHPRYLELALEQLADWPGQLAAYAGFFDIQISKAGRVRLRDAGLRPFHLEDQIEKPFIDLNSFLHSRRLFETLGGFDERLARRQDYDLISRYCWSREPQTLPYVLNLYQRFDAEEQITRLQRTNAEAPAIIGAKIEGYYTQGLPARLPPWLKKVSVLSWDMSRNHFAKAFCVADALSKHVEVELVSFRFFEEEMFQPLADVKPGFETKYFDGGTFPDFFDNFARGVDAITGDAIYAVKPRLTSFGMGLLANYHTGKPLMLECNDLETVVGSAKAKDAHLSHPLEAVLDRMEKAVVPHDVLWSQVLDPLVTEIPVTFTHNVNLNIHYRKRSLYMRNIKDDRLYDPARYDRDGIRRSLGFGPEDRVILFGGLVRKHKGIFELIELLDQLNDPRYKLLVVGSRETPDLRKLSQQHRESVVILPPQPPERMAEINLAADLVVLWFDPDIPAGNYQSPYKMSDALAMGPSIIGSPTSDLADFARRDLLWTVAFGDSDGLVARIREIFADPAERLRRQNRARAFFQREFSYKSVHPAFALGASGLERDRVYPAAERFAAVFAEFEKRARARGQ